MQASGTWRIASEGKYSVDIGYNEKSAGFVGGLFYDISVAGSPVFTAVIEKISDKSEVDVSSLSEWERVEKDGDTLRFTNPDSLGDITFIIRAESDGKGISWYTEIENKSEEYSVISVNYPIPKIRCDRFNILYPAGGGRVCRNAGVKGLKYNDVYPHHYASMQYFAYYGDRGGLYLGIHDENASMKVFDIKCENGESLLSVKFHAIGAGRKCNSFSLGGCMRWEAFLGDWYDATVIYRDFVYAEAKWLPEIDENGRPDTLEKFKAIPYWIVDYMPNTPEQRDVRPKVLGAVSHMYHKDYWFDAPIQLQKRLGTPIGYHVYNWHKNPFNINYPHFEPKDEFLRGLPYLRGKDINVMPYINGVSWETHDADEGFEVNFENTGRFGAALDKYGNPITVSYPQKKENGKDTELAPMCPSFPEWRKIVDGLARKIENELDVDGIYFDEIAAHTPHPCRSEEHGHIPGGGSYWSDGYNELMDIVNKNKRPDFFYVSESSGEPYMKSFDGFLTWLWRWPDDVPAFPAVYAGYIVMLGRFSDGISREKEEVFRRNVAQALLFGQQIGWIFADVVYKESRMEFLEKFVKMRYSHTKTFTSSVMLRPPKLDGNEDEMLLSGAWKRRNGRETVIFVANISDEERDFSLSFNNGEYGIDPSRLCGRAEVSGDSVVIKGRVPAGDVIDIRF